MKCWYFKYSLNPKGHVGFFMFSSTEAHSSNTVCSVTVSGEKMPAMTTGMQLQVSLHFPSVTQKYWLFFQCGDKSKYKMGKKKT